MAEKYYTKTFTLPDGRRKYVRAKTKDELERKVAELKRDMSLGIDITDKTTFGELAKMWYDTYKAPYLRPSTAANVKRILNIYVMPYLAAMELKKIKPVHIQHMMTAHAHLSHATQSHILVYTKAIFDCAVDNGLIIKSPVPKSTKAGGAPTQEKTPLTVAQSEELLTALRDIDKGFWLMTLIMLEAGLRGEEVRGLMWHDIDWQKGIINVRRTGVILREQEDPIITSDMKSASAKRLIPMTGRLQAAMSELKSESASPYIISYKGQPVTRTKYDAYRRALHKFGAHPHILRHTCITRWVEHGLAIKEVQYLAGHSTATMTMNVYAHYDQASRFAETTEKIRAL